MDGQTDLFGGATTWSDLPSGFRYQESLITPAEEGVLLERVAALPLREFEFQGFTGKRRVMSFGWTYDFSTHRLEAAEPMPSFLLALRAAAAAFAGLEEEALAHALVTEYGAGASIGWHRDRPEFGDVIGVSLGAPCVFRFRRKRAERWERRSVTARPRSAYLLRGSSRTEWEHSIPPVDAPRHSVTFRTLRQPPG